MSVHPHASKRRVSFPTVNNVTGEGSDERGPVRGRLTIDWLSDDELLCIFDIYRRGFECHDVSWPWHELVHVCQRWRRIILASPHYLDLRLLCQSRAAVLNALDVWPSTMPISILNHDGDDELMGELIHSDRIAGVSLSSLIAPQLEACATMMQQSFPILRYLLMSCFPHNVPAITDPFLGGSAPRLERLSLCHVPFPTLPEFLLSSTGLVELDLGGIPRAGYIPPDTMANCISMLTKLQTVAICYRSTASFPNLTTRRSPPLTRAVLPSLTKFEYRGVSEYLEDLISRVDAPLLDHLSLKFFSHHIFDISQLPQFIYRIDKLKSPVVKVKFNPSCIEVHLSPPAGGTYKLDFSCSGLDKQLLLLEQIFAQSLLLHGVDELNLSGQSAFQQNQQHSAMWLGFLRPFDSVTVLYILGDDKFHIHIAGVLGALTEERAAEVLPMLRTIVWKKVLRVRDLVSPLLDPFIDARQLLNCPVALQGSL